MVHEVGGAYGVVVVCIHVLNDPLLCGCICSFWGCHAGLVVSWCPIDWLLSLSSGEGAYGNAVVTIPARPAQFGPAIGEDLVRPAIASSQRSLAQRS